MGSINSSLRQDVWRAAYDALAGNPDRRALADSIAEGFSDIRHRTSKSSGVSPETKAAIERDLAEGGYSYSAIKDRHGVGMSTVQRVASDLRARGITVRTAGQTNPGSPIN